MPKGRLKLEPITNNSERNQTFKKRKRGIIKKVNELATLCGVKACAVINSGDKTEPEFWPSREGAEEVYSKFKGVLPEERFKRMYDQERYLWEKIKKEEEKVMKLYNENREIELREVMFDLLNGKMISPHHYNDASFMEDLIIFMGGYVKKLTHRTEFLEGRDVGNVDPVVVGTEDPTEFYDHMPQYNGSYDHENMNNQEPFQYQTPGNFYNQTQPRFYGSRQDMYTGLNHDQGQSSNQYPNSNESYMSLLMGQPHQMSDVQDLANVSSMDDNNNRNHQLPITSQMPSTTTTAADLYGHCITNKRWPTGFGLD